MIPSNKKNYYDLTLCVMDKDDPTKVEIYYPVIAADSVLLKPGGRQTILHHIEDKTQQLHLTDEIKSLLRSDPEHGGLVRLDSKGHIPLQYIEPRLVALYFEFDTVEDMLNQNTFNEGDYGRLVLVRDCTGDTRIHTKFPLEWVIYRLTDGKHPSSINSYTAILQKHDMDKSVSWDELDHGIQASIQKIDEMVRKSHTHPNAIKELQDVNGSIAYKGKKVIFRDKIQAVITTNDRSELNHLNVGDIGILVTKSQELIIFDQRRVGSITTEDGKELVAIDSVTYPYDDIVAQIHLVKAISDDDNDEVEAISDLGHLYPDVLADMDIDKNITTEDGTEISSINTRDYVYDNIVADIYLSEPVEHESPFIDITGNRDEMYKGTRGLLEGPKLRTKNLTSCKGFFENCPDLESYMWYDTSNCTNMSYMNHGCSKLKYIPSLSMASAKNINNFAESSGIVRYFDLFSESVEYANYVFKGCLKMECIDVVYLPNAITTTEFFSGDVSLKNLPRVINVSSSKNVDGFFEDCSALEQVYSVKAESAVSMKRMFKGCSNLVSIASINMNSCKNTTEMFSGCSKLQYIGIAQGTLHTNISFIGTKISITCLRNIIKGLNDSGLGYSINIQGTPAGRDLTADDEAAIRAKGWNLIY